MKNCESCIAEIYAIIPAWEPENGEPMYNAGFYLEFADTYIYVRDMDKPKVYYPDGMLNLEQMKDLMPADEQSTH